MNFQFLKLAIFAMLFCGNVLALNESPKMKMFYKNEEILNILETYAKLSGQKFVIDPGVRGKVSIFSPAPLALDEAFNQISSALALNGFAMSRQGDTLIVKSSRNIQRDLIEVSNNLPTLKPERMFTWIYTPQFISAEKINNEIRIFSSKDGEVVTSSNANQIIFTDWVSNLHRIKEILASIDIKSAKAK